MFSSPFIEERLYLLLINLSYKQNKSFSSPFIEERLYLLGKITEEYGTQQFSSPFIEERLYLINLLVFKTYLEVVLVPFYRGAVVFRKCLIICYFRYWFSSPFIEERLYLDLNRLLVQKVNQFSSPFIEERLYLQLQVELEEVRESSRPLLSRSGCI